MKKRITYFLHTIGEGTLRTVSGFPLESILILMTAISCVLAFENSWSDERLAQLALLPLFVAVAFAMNHICMEGAWRWVYRLSWVPLPALIFAPELEQWVGSARYATALLILAPLAVLLCRRARDNGRFLCDTAIYLRSLLVALLFSNVALVLFEAILWSTAYIFGFEDARWVNHVSFDVFLLAETLFTPLLFLALSDRRSGTECRDSRLRNTLLNYVFTPALMIYAAILYTYMAKILLMWSLPRGGVAYMVLCFTLAAFVVKGWRMLPGKRSGEWFYRRLSWIVLPAVGLFWTGFVRRVGPFGWTEERVYLLLCGLVATIAILLFFSRRTGRYLWLCTAAFLLFAAVTFLPPLSPVSIGVSSQTARAVRYARQLGLLDSTGRFVVRRIPLSDTVRRDTYRELFAALEYVGRKDDNSLREIGIEEPVWELRNRMLPDKMMDYTTYGYEAAIHDVILLELPENCTLETDPRYPRLHTNLPCYDWSDPRGYTFYEDTLRIWLGRKKPIVALSGDDLLTHLCRQSGFRPAESEPPTGDTLLRMLDYRGEEMRILFRYLRIEQRNSSAYKLDDTSIELIMTR